MTNTAHGLLQNKVIIVTGASQGIGRGIVIGLAQAGASILAHYQGTEQSEIDILSLKDEVLAINNDSKKFSSVSGDISKSETATKIVEASILAFGEQIDGLVSNAGICQFFEFLDIPHAIWETTRSVNLDGCFFVVQAVAKQMSVQPIQGGSIVAISSISALVGGGGQCHYTPTKAGVNSLMQSCAISLAPYNIRCNSLLPGTIETAINQEDLSSIEKRNYMKKRIPLGRLGEPKDLAGPTIFLLSDMSSYVTGASLLVDGGLFVNLQ